MTRFLVAIVSAVALVVGAARGQTWTNAASDFNWNNANDWSPATVPNSTTADAIFTNAGVGTVSLSSGVSVRSLTFNNTTGNYTLTSTSAVMNNLTAITIGPDVTTQQTINLANLTAGSLLFTGTGAGALMITNNSLANPGSTTLLIGPNTVIGTSGFGGVTVTGVGARTVISGSFASGADAVIGGLTKSGPSILSLTGSGTNLAGGLMLNGGTVQFDYTTNTTAKIGGGPFVSTGGTLVTFPNGSTASTQNFSSTAFNAGDTEDRYQPGATPTLGFGAMTRAAGATYSNTMGVSIATTTTGNTNGLWGSGPAFAVSGSTWLANNGSGFLINVPAGPTNTFSSGINTDVSGNIAPSTFTTNSLRFNTGSTFLGLTGTNTLQSGGILVTANATGSSDIYGGTLTSGQNEVIVHTYADFAIYSSITASAGLTKAGPNTLTLGGANFGLTGPINVNRGNLTISTTNAVNNASTISFNDNDGAAGNASQTFTIDLGSGITDSINRPIQFATNSNSAGGVNFANTITTGLSENSHVTLNGVISSAPGTVTPIRFNGTFSNSSGFILTANNTFTGDVSLFQGSLGIYSDANLGNPANTLYLDTFGTTGRLIFLSSGITVARSVVINTPTGVVSNSADVNTISGPVSGGNPLYKDGTGTLVLSGTNSQLGLQVNAGTVSVGFDANLGSTSGAMSMNSGTMLAVTGTFTNVRNVAIGPFSGDVPGTVTIDVAAGQTLTQFGSITGGLGGLIKTNAGNLALTSLTNTYGGGTTIQQGFLLASGDTSLGAAGTPVTIGVAGTLIYNGNTTTSRTFFNSGTLTAPTGTTVTLSGASVYGGFLRGFGTFALTNGASLVGTSTFNSLSTTLTGTGSYVNFSNGGALTIAAGTSNTATLNGFINQGSGAITAGAQSSIFATDFQTYGTLTINPATPTQNFSQTTLMSNLGNSQLFFNGGSRTFIGTPATAVFPSNWPNVSQRGLPTFVAGIDLAGKNAVVAGGLFVNNGYVEDSSNNFSGTATIVADFGSLVKGAGYFQNTVQTINGGKFQAGNSPGKATFGSFVLGPGGVNNYLFAIDDATGTGGPSPDAAGQVSGWGLVKAISRGAGAAPTTGDFTWTATPNDKLTISLETLVNPTTVGVDVPGLMDHFDPTRSYTWPAFEWTGSHAGPADVATLEMATSFDTSGFANPVAGTFGWALDSTGHTLSLTYTPSVVPEPGTLAMTGATLGLLALGRRRRRRTLRF
jgi:autotransporter-associated beta strand protein